MESGYQVVLENLCQEVKVKRKKKMILTNVNLEIKAGEFIAIVGCSGAGKTTLMNILSGYQRPSAGKVMINGYDLHEYEEEFKGKIGYVPQQEILDRTLTLYDSLNFSLNLRVRNVPRNKADTIIKNVLQTVELSHVKNVLVKNLSGGERKRAAIATEMLSNPNLFLLDEPTSGLDANIEKKIMKKLKAISLEGKTVVITAHTVSNLYLCDKIIFMGRDGKICYYGPYKDACSYFNVSEFVDIYDVLKENTQQWYLKFKKENKVCKIEKNKEKLQKAARVNFFKQTSILVKRYVSSLFHNKALLALLLGQAVLMGSLICLAIQRDSFLEDPRFSAMITAAFALAAIWLGLFNTIQEIVKEKDILKKEYMSGLNYASYIVSKIVIFSVLCLWQAFACITIVYFYLNPRPEEVLFFNTWGVAVINFFLVAFSTSTMGLLISSFVKETKTTIILAPLYMMIQLLFSGIFVPLVDLTQKISYGIIGRWGYEGFATIFNLSSYGVQEFEKGAFAFTRLHLFTVWSIFLGSSIIFLYISILVIRHNLLSKHLR